MAKKKEEVTTEDVTEVQTKALIEDLKKQFEELLTSGKIGQATVIFTVEGESEPQVYRKGHFYDCACMLNHVMSAYRARAAMDLGF